MPIMGSSEPRLFFNYGASSQNFLADYTTDKLSKSSHGLVEGQIINLSNSGGALPVPLSEDTEYYVRDVTTDEFKLSESYMGTAINLIDNGSGTNSYSTEIEYDLDHSEILKNEPEWDNIWHQSQVGGSVINYHRGYFWVFEVQVNLHKYGSPKTLFLKLAWLIGREVVLSPHRDNGGIKDEDSNLVNFAVLEVIPFYKERIACLYDACIIKLKSTEYVDITKTID